MYEERSSIDWKGLFLKVLIVFLVVIIAVKGYSVLKGNKDSNKTTTETETVAKSSSTFTANMEKLKEAGAKYFSDNKAKLPTTEGNTTMVTLTDLIDGGYLTELADEDGKTCNGDSSYVTATLESDGVKQKTNLVCGDAASYSMAYMDQNDSKVSNDSDYTYSINNSSTRSSSTSSNNNASGCTSGNCAPSVSVNTNVSQKVSINGNSSKSSKVTASKPNNKNSRYYTVRFDRNGGNVSYPSQTVKEYNTVSYPGNNSKSGCSFQGWYYNGSKYDFNESVTSDMTLEAKYSCSNYSYNNNDRYYDDYYEDGLTTDTYTTTVYTMGWDTKGTNYVSINHTLRLPSALNNSNVRRVRIKKINYSGPINTLSRLNTYSNRHGSTFMYNPNGWEATEDNYASNLSTINSGAVSFYYNNGYKSLSSARNNGFDVNWTADYVSKQCTRTFSVNGEDNKCDYGIYYTVTWEYETYR